MSQLISESISAIFQLVVFTLIPFLFFLFRRDKTVTFFRYIGMYKAPKKSIIYVIAVSMLFFIAGIGLAFTDNSIKQALLSPNSVTGKIRLMGFSVTSVLVLLIIALVKTSLAEEILFRGFLAKQLIKKLGFKTGNLLQAVIFGIIHLLLFRLLVTTAFFPLIFIFVFSSFAGWAIGYVKEKHAKGSIVPGWVAHGLGNVLSYSLVAFVL